MRESLKKYKELKGNTNIFDLAIIHEIMCHKDVDQIEDERLIDIACIVRECHLKDDNNFQLYEIVDAVLLNYKDIKDNDMSPREILRKYL